jgi:hypothetical protein
MLLLFIKRLRRVQVSKPIEYFLQLADHFRRPGWVFGRHLGYPIKQYASPLNQSRHFRSSVAL